MLTETLLVVLLLVGGWLCWHHGGLPWWKDSREIPGPLPWPVVGNLFHVFHPQLPIHFSALAKQYGPIYRLRLWNKDLIILNNTDLIREALLKKWSDFAGRPHSFVADLVSCGGKDLSLGNYTPTWQKQRRLAHVAFQRILRGDVEQIVQDQARYLCKVFRGYDGQSVDLAHDFSLQTCWVICTALFGPLDISTVKELHNCTLNLVRKWNATSTQIVDSLPLLKIFPNITLRSLLLCLRVRDTLIQGELKKHQESCHSSEACHMVDYLLQFLEEHETGKQGNADLDLDHIHMITVDMLVGGTETTATLLTWTVAFLLHYPQIQEKIHEELMMVIGPNRDPTYSDREHLPYLNATIMETLRLRPSVPLALPHMTICDTRLAGFSIPKGTTVIPNLYGAHHDESKWHRSLDFRPERFLEGNGLNDVQRHLLPFSCGPRVCLGESLARMESFLFLAHLLQNFQILPPSPGCLPDLRGCFEFLVHCPPFMVRLVPRAHAEPAKGEIRTSTE